MALERNVKKKPARTADRRNVWLLILTTLLIVVSVVLFTPPNEKINQGLDIQGGLSVVLTAKGADGAAVSNDDMEKSRAIIESRVNALGASEAVVQVQGTDQILVQIPGLTNTEDALNPIGKTGKIANLLATGQSIVVQIAKEAISTKGPRLTSDISLAGRNVVLIPFSNKISISQKIRSAEERKRLKKIALSILPKNYGVIIRTAAQGKNETDIGQDITSLIDKWEEVLRNIKTLEPPSLLLGEMNRANTILRDSLNGSFSAIVVDDKEMQTMWQCS
mgnify:CR=1 FL=1